ncbi:MAG: hypothetical protein CSA31_00945 [Desulfobulbus propionicus]|nr:MAG: hypothetical protein CSB34_02140 [Desulfobulbus propionicus]PIE60653.1 MAG: hypothetical protein CSA31_00945 [Desulfobulbus propionicus]
METGNDCLACFMKQALNTVKLATDDVDMQYQILTEVGAMLGSFPRNVSPPENAVGYYRLIAEKTKTPDPYAGIKKRSNDFALSLEKQTQKFIEQSRDPLLAALRFAIGANVLDNGAQQQLGIEETLAACQEQELVINHYKPLCEKLAASRNVLLLADNCGEIVFDKLLVQQLQNRGLTVTVGVRGGPAINDATLAEAQYVGIDKLCKVIPNGADVPGTALSMCTDEFTTTFAKADCILAKGMGNFECLSEVKAPLFFLFTVKCSTVRDHLHRRFEHAAVKIGSPVILCSKEMNQD